MRKEKIATVNKDIYKVDDVKNHPIIYNNGKKTIEVKVKSFLSISDRIKAVEQAVQLCFIETNGKVKYFPEVKEYVKRLVIVGNYSNFKVTGDVEKDWEILFTTPLYSDVVERVGEDAELLLSAIDERIANEVQYLNTHKDFNILVEKINGKLDELVKDFNREDVMEITKVLRKIPGNISTNDLVDAILSRQK